jgi:intein/homing endonuclease
MQPAHMRQGLWVGEGEFSYYGAEQKRKEKKKAPVRILQKLPVFLGKFFYMSP